MASLHMIERLSGCHFVDLDHTKPLGPFQCRAKRFCLKHAGEHGEDHLARVMRLITAEPHNSNQLYQSTIAAVSLFLLEGDYQGPDRTIAEDVIKSLDLGQMRDQVNAVNLKFASYRFADRLISLTQAAVF